MERAVLPAQEVAARFASISSFCSLCKTNRSPWDSSSNVSSERFSTCLRKNSLSKGTNLWIAWDPKKQGWHDKLAHTVVVRPKGGTTQKVAFPNEKKPEGA